MWCFTPHSVWVLQGWGVSRVLRVTSLLVCIPGVLQLLVLDTCPSYLVQGSMGGCGYFSVAPMSELLWMLASDTCLAALRRDSTSGVGNCHQLVLGLLLPRVQGRCM